MIHDTLPDTLDLDPDLGILLLVISGVGIPLPQDHVHVTGPGVVPDLVSCGHDDIVVHQCPGPDVLITLVNELKTYNGIRDEEKTTQTY